MRFRGLELDALEEMMKHIKFMSKICNNGKETNKLNEFEKDQDAIPTTKEELKGLLGGVCTGIKNAEETTHLYEEELGLIAELKLECLETWLKEIVHEYKISKNEKKGSADEQIAFNAFYTLHILYRRMFAPEKLKSLMAEHRETFEEHNIMLHLKVLEELNVRGDDNRITEELVEKANKNVELFPDQSGVLHCLSDVAVTVCEMKLMKESNILTPSEDYENYSKKWLEIAKENVEDAIELSPEYAKYYSTKARILSLQNDFDEAMHFLELARSKESERGNYYSNKMMSFNLYQSQIETRKMLFSFKATIQQTKKENAELQDKLKECKHEIDLWTHRNLEFLALFAAAMSFIIGGITITKDATNDPKDIMGIICVLFGCTGSILAAFDRIISIPEKAGQREKLYWGMWTICIFIIILGIAAIFVP